MIKKIWCSWFQGYNDLSFPKENKKYINHWRSLNSNYEFHFITYDNVSEYLPKFLKICNKAKHERTMQAQADLLRLMLLEKYGGVWIDTSLYPVLPLDNFLHKVINHTGFFTYRFFKRDIGREICNWFLAVDRPNHELIKKWRAAYQERFKHSLAKDFNQGLRYYESHRDLTKLYDTDQNIKKIIDDMVQINVDIPLSAGFNFKEYKHIYGQWKSRQDSFMYKRPIFGK